MQQHVTADARCLRHARGLRRRSGRSCVRRVERARRSAHLPTNGEGGRFPVRQYNVGSTGVCPVWCAACGVGEAGFPYRHPSEAEGAGGGDGGDDRRMPAHPPAHARVHSRSSPATRERVGSNVGRISTVSRAHTLPACGCPSCRPPRAASTETAPRRHPLYTQ